VQYTRDNHLQYGWISSVEDRSKRFYVTRIGECQRKPGVAIDEAVLAARRIKDEFGPDIVLCMSGGIDSECMARAFLEARIPFRAAIARYMPQALNEPDIQDAFKFCERFQIPVKVFEIDLIRFFETEKKHLMYAEKFACRSPQLAVHMDLLDRVRAEMGGVPVLAGNPIEIEFDFVNARAVLCMTAEPHLSYLRYFSDQKTPGVPFFFSDSPELIYSFWQTPQFRHDLQMVAETYLLTQQNGSATIPPRFENELKFSYLGKIRKYQQGGFDVRPRDCKRTGFEEAKSFFRDYFLDKKKIPEGFPHEPFRTQPLPDSSSIYYSSAGISGSADFRIDKMSERLNRFKVSIANLDRKNFDLKSFFNFWNKAENFKTA
jgi:hypothetical protein